MSEKAFVIVKSETGLEIKLLETVAWAMSKSLTKSGLKKQLDIELALVCAPTADSERFQIKKS